MGVWVMDRARLEAVRERARTAVVQQSGQVPDSGLAWALEILDALLAEPPQGVVGGQNSWGIGSLAEWAAVSTTAQGVR